MAGELLGEIELNHTPWQKFLYTEGGVRDYLTWSTLTGRKYRDNSIVTGINYDDIVANVRRSIRDEIANDPGHDPERTTQGLDYWRWLNITINGEAENHLFETGDGYLGAIYPIRRIAAREFLGINNVYSLYYAY